MRCCGCSDDPIDPGYVLTDLGDGRGLGLLAARDMEKGDRISLWDDRLLRVSDTERSCPRKLQHAWNSCAESKKESFLRLHANPKAIAEAAQKGFHGTLGLVTAIIDMNGYDEALPARPWTTSA